MTNFEALYRQYAKDVFRFALYLSGDHAMAEDITSETFVRAWTSPSVKRMTTVKAYLMAIARNLYLDEIERRKRHSDLSDSATDGSDLTRQTELRDALKRATEALQKIPEGDRAALLMRVVDEMAYEEIASALGISLAAAKTRIFRARLRLTQLQETLEWQTRK